MCCFALLPLSCCLLMISDCVLKRFCCGGGNMQRLSWSSEIVSDLGWCDVFGRWNVKDRISRWTTGLVSYFTLEHGHFVGRFFERLQCLWRKWNGFLHLDWTACSSTLCFLCWFAVNIAIFWCDFTPVSRGKALPFAQMSYPEKNKVRLRSSRASSRCWCPVSLRRVLNWFGKMPKILRKHGCRFILSISFDAPEGMLFVLIGEWFPIYRIDS